MADKKEKIEKIAGAGPVGKLNTSVHNSNKRFLEAEFNGAGLIVGIEAYGRLKGQPNYTRDFKEVYPELEVLTGIIDSAAKNIFTITGEITLPEMAQDLAIVLFKKTDLDALNTVDNFKNLSNPDLVETIKITAINGEEKKITLERSPLNLGFTECVILKNDGFIKIAQLTNFDVEESQDKIDTDTQTSGAYKSSMGGKKSSAISGIKGLYDPLIPSCQILETAYNAENTIRARTGAMKEKYASYTTATYKVTQFTTSGEVSGNGRLEYTTNLDVQSGQIEKGNFI